MSRPRHPSRRRGTIYLAVFALAMLVLVLGLGGIMASRVQARGAFESTSAAAAREYAASAAQLGRWWIASNPAWRTTHANGPWITGSPFENGTISLSVVNPSGALNRSTLDPVVMTATGASGAAIQKLRLTLTPSPRPLSCLGPALCAGGNVLLDGAVLTAPGLVVSSNGSVTLTGGGATMRADVEAKGSASGSIYSGTKKTGQPAKDMPSIATVINEYTLIGSAMSRASVPIISGDSTFRGVLLSPAVPLYGATAQANGVYILDCKGNNLVLDEVRVVGTLVLVNCGTLSLKGAVMMSPAVANYPCLIVQGNLEVADDAQALSENSVGTNLNPSTTPWPYPGGYSNATATDTYPCSLGGLVYVSGSLLVDKKEWMLGPTIVGGSVTVKDEVWFFPRPEYAANPPPGFANVDMVASGAVWERAVD